MTPSQHNTIVAALTNEMTREWGRYHRAEHRTVKARIYRHINDLREAREAFSKEHHAER